MKRVRNELTGALSGVLMLTAIFWSALDPTSGTAQMPNQDRQPGPWDMWNPDWMQRDMWSSGAMGIGMHQRIAQHWTFMNQGVPAEYVGASIPFSVDAEMISEGRALYQQNCASCHGATSVGDGEAARARDPSPALLSFMIQRPIAVDEYLLWSISDGDSTFGTAMPPFKDVLTPDEIWRIITFMRAGYPPEPSDNRG